MCSFAPFVRSYYRCEAAALQQVIGATVHFTGAVGGLGGGNEFGGIVCE